MRTLSRYVLALLILAAVIPSVANSQSYPRAPVKMVVGFAPGGLADVICRIVAKGLSEELGAHMLVDNKPGANSNIASAHVAKARPDGYTLLYNSSAIVINSALGMTAEFSVFDDLSPVSLVGSAPLTLFVHPSIPVRTLREFIDFLKKNPGKLSYGSSGIGNNNHLGTLLFLQKNGLEALHIPYKGTADFLNDALAGRIDFAMQTMAAMLPSVKEKRINALAIASRNRSNVLPDLPTFSEATMPGFEMGTWQGVMAPAKTPSSIVKSINAGINRTLNNSGVRFQLISQGVEPYASTEAEYKSYIRAEYERWKTVIEVANVKL